MILIQLIEDNQLYMDVGTDMSPGHVCAYHLLL